MGVQLGIARPVVRCTKVAAAHPDVGRPPSTPSDLAAGHRRLLLDEIERRLRPPPHGRSTPPTPPSGPAERPQQRHALGRRKSGVDGSHLGRFPPTSGSPSVGSPGRSRPADRRPRPPRPSPAGRPGGRPTPPAPPPSPGSSPPTRPPPGPARTRRRSTSRSATSSTHPRPAKALAVAVLGIEQADLADGGTAPGRPARLSPVPRRRQSSAGVTTRREGRRPGLSARSGGGLVGVTSEGHTDPMARRHLDHIADRDRRRSPAAPPRRNPGDLSLSRPSRRPGRVHLPHPAPSVATSSSSSRTSHAVGPNRARVRRPTSNTTADPSILGPSDRPATRCRPFDARPFDPGE